MAGLPSAHIETVGVKRKGPGASGTAVKVYTNHFPCDIPDGIIYHYDGEWCSTVCLFATRMC